MQEQDSDQRTGFWVSKRTVRDHIPYTIPSECLPASAITSATDILGICPKVSHWVDDDGFGARSYHFTLPYACVSLNSAKILEVLHRGRNNNFKGDHQVRVRVSYSG